MPGRLDALQPATRERAFHNVEMLEPLGVPFVRQMRNRIGYGISRVAGEEGIKFRTQEPAARGPLVGKDADVARNIRSGRRKFMATDRANGRMSDGRIGAKPGLHRVGAAFVV